MAKRIANVRENKHRKTIGRNGSIKKQVRWPGGRHLQSKVFFAERRMTQASGFMAK
jgi:hypothetical protein